MLEPRPRHERVLLSVVQQAYVDGVSTRAVDHPAEALGLQSIYKDQVSRICKGLYTTVHAFRAGRLDADCPHPHVGLNIIIAVEVPPASEADNQAVATILDRPLGL